MSMHNDLNLLDSVFMKHLEKHAISDLTKTASCIFENLEQLDQIAPYLDVYYRQYIQKLVLDITAVMKNQKKTVDAWQKILVKIKDRIYVSMIANNIFDFVKMMDDEDCRENCIRIMTEVKQTVHQNDVE